MRSTTRVRHAIAFVATITAALAAALALAACNGDDDGTGPSQTRQLLIAAIGDQLAGEPFDVTVTLADAQGTPVAADVASTISLSVDTGLGALGGTTSGNLAAGSSSVTITGVTYDHGEDGVRLEATGDGGTADNLSVVSNAFTLGFDFDRQLVAFRRTIGNRVDIYLMTPDASAFVNLTDNPATDTDPAWSPDGSKIAFVSARSGNSDLWVMNVDGSGLTQLTDNEGSIRFPNWSPDGSLIAYSANVNDQRDIYVIEAPGAGPLTPASSAAAAALQPTQVTNHPDVDNEPVWTPDGGKIIFFSTRDGSDGALWSIDFTGTGGENPVRLTLEFIFVFACAPGSGYSIVDGRIKISFVGETDGQFDIWTMDLDGSNQMNVTDDAPDDFYSDFMSDPPTLTASGPAATSALQESRLVFDSNRDGDWQLYSINEDGTDLVRLTNYPSDDEIPRWRPGGPFPSAPFVSAGSASARAVSGAGSISQSAVGEGVSLPASTCRRQY